ncbi:aquaporin 12 [Lepisosteus oculatus]|uniref:aquaporin 12 n=1 Tax=Lepisosteus oculatus TaxID=7918 RepID=UPI0035F51A54
MSGLNVSFGYFLAVAVLAGVGGRLLRLRPLRHFSAELPASFMLVACWSEVQTITNLGQWAGGYGPDVTSTVLFVTLVAHGLVSPGASGNPAVTLRSFLLGDASAPAALSGLAGQVAGASLGGAPFGLATCYWSLELTDMHLIQKLMSSECSPALRVPALQGALTEAACSLAWHLLALRLERSPELPRVLLSALALTALSHVAGSYTSGYLNPALAAALTFRCPGFSLREYAAAYWLGPAAGMAMALFLYVGHIPRLFSRNLLYSQKSRYRVPRGKSARKWTETAGTAEQEKKRE